MRRLYAQFVAAGDLVFDIGAHAGNRVRGFSALGCRVVALEPQPDFARLLRMLFGRSRRIDIVEMAVGDAAGRAVLTFGTLHWGREELNSEINFLKIIF